MQPVLLIDVVGLSPRMIGPRTPALAELARTGSLAPLGCVLPAVTCSAQATMLTGTLPREHGAVGNGWFERDSGEVHLWRQSNALVRGTKFYERLAEIDPAARCAKIFWWWNMGARVALSITPRPFYPADGRKIVATYSAPAEYGRGLESRLGPFPFFDFWGPQVGPRLQPLACRRGRGHAAARATGLDHGLPAAPGLRPPAPGPPPTRAPWRPSARWTACAAS
jgi:hypothetical protein